MPPCRNAREPHPPAQSCRACSALLSTSARLVPMTQRNSTANGRRMGLAEWIRLDFAHEPLFSDASYCCGCLKYVPRKDDKDRVSFRVRSIYRHAGPVFQNGEWFWRVYRRYCHKGAKRPNLSAATHPINLPGREVYRKR